MNSSRWRVAVGSLLPLAPGAVILTAAPGEALSVVLLLAAVVLACWIGDLAAGIMAALLASSEYLVFVLPPPFAVAAPAVPHLAGFVLAAGAVLALCGRLRRNWRRAELGRQEAERRAAALAGRVELIAPILDRAPVGFALVDTELRYRYVNQQLADFNRIPVAEHLGRRAADLFPPELAELVEAPVRRVLQTGEVHHHVTVTVPRTDGDRHYHCSRYPVRDPAGRIVGVAISVLDSTEQLRLQRSHERALAELTATLQSSPLAVALINPDLTYKQVNRAFQELSAGLPPVVPAMCREVLDTGRSAGALDVVMDDHERHLTARCFPVRLDSGEVVAVALVLLDVTEQHRLAKLEAEAQTLRATAEIAFKLEEVQRLAGFGSWEMDLETGRITWSKQMRAIAGDVDRYVEHGGRVIMHPDDVERAAYHRRRLVDEKLPYAEEFRLVRPDGAVRDVLATGAAIRDADGVPVRLWGTLQDVTEHRSSQRAARDALRSAERAHEQLDAEHRALQMFLSAMLPARLPQVPAAELAAAYLPVAERVDVGGDWYDAFELPDGRVALAVGDVTGHDLRAATVMGQVRNAVRAYAIEDPAPGAVLARANRLLNSVPELAPVTMIYGVYDPAAALLTWANAGHPAPLLRRGGTVSTLAEPGGLILGVLAGDTRYAEGSLVLEPGDTVLWFTDGLVDQRHADPVQARGTLAEVFAAGGGEPDRLLVEVTTRMLRDRPQEDDVCLLALHRQRIPAEALGADVDGTDLDGADVHGAAVDGAGVSRSAAEVAGAAAEASPVRR